MNNKQDSTKFKMFTVWLRRNCDATFYRSFVSKNEGDRPDEYMEMWRMGSRLILVQDFREDGFDVYIQKGGNDLDTIKKALVVIMKEERDA